MYVYRITKRCISAVCAYIQQGLNPVYPRGEEKGVCSRMWWPSSSLQPGLSPPHGNHTIDFTSVFGL